jgi:hypothetical protein
MSRRIAPEYLSDIIGTIAPKTAQVQGDSKTSASYREFEALQRVKSNRPNKLDMELTPVPKLVPRPAPDPAPRPATTEIIKDRRRGSRSMRTDDA